LSQSRCAELIQHYGGILRNGAVVAILATVILRPTLADVPMHALLAGALK
jgi:hypothetical protein